MKKQKICIVTFVSTQSGALTLSKFLNVLISLIKIPRIVVCTPLSKKNFNFGRTVRVHYIYYNIQNKDLISKIYRQLWLQIKIIKKLISIRKEVSNIVLFFGSDQVLPILAAKILKIQTTLVITGSIANSAREVSGHLTGLIYQILEKCSFFLVDRIVVYSKRMIANLKIQKFKNKIVVAYYNFVDFEKFRIKTKYSKRKEIIGFIGRLSEEKGILNLIRIFPRILKEYPDLKLFIIGDGHLKSEVFKYVKANKLNQNIIIFGWLAQAKIPDILNELKLLVLPSFGGEGLPMVVIEAMACGTPVLVTPVGSIPEFVQDGKNGFIVTSNSAENIEKAVISTLQRKDMEKIIRTARMYAQKKFYYLAAAERYKFISRI